MWTIRQEQTEAFRQHHLQKFEDEMVEHLKKFSPQQCRVAGEPAVRQVIRMGIENGGKYGFTNRGPLRFYIELMFMFGSYFDTDPQYPWVNAVLNDAESVDQMVRADRLFNAMNEYLPEVPGPENKNYLQALRRLSETKIADLLRPNVSLEDSAFQGLLAVYPQTCEYLGERKARSIIQQSFTVASKHGLTSPKGMLLVVALTFFMGHGFPADHLCNWIARRLDEERFPDPAKRTEELYTKATQYVKHVLAESAQA